jgi:hypothetical protein
MPHDIVTNAAPVTLHNPDATSTLRVVPSTGPGPAPDASKRSSASTLQGGRKGKNIKAPSSMLPGDMDPPTATTAAAAATTATATALFQQEHPQATQAAEEVASAAVAVPAASAAVGGDAPLVTPTSAQEQTAATSDPIPVLQQATPNVVII